MFAVTKKTDQMKKFLTFCGLVLFYRMIAQTPIEQELYGQNAWYTYYVTWAGPPSTPPSPHSTDHFIPTIAKAKESGARYCRIGGANANLIGNDPSTAPNPITKEQIAFLVKQVRDAGMIPVVQVPYVNPGNNHLTLGSEASNAGDIVNYINNNSSVTAYTGGPVQDWIIANEPDEHEKILETVLTKVGYDYNFNLLTSPGNIAKYIRQFAIEMRKVDPSIKIIGPELAQYSNHMFFGGMYGSQDFTGLGLMEIGSPNDITTLIGTTDELGNPVPSGIQNLPYINTISFHFYNPAAVRDYVISDIHIGGDPWKLRYGLDKLKDEAASSAMIAQRTYSSTNYPLTIGITEANVAIESASTNPGSFLAGQFWSDFIDLCMTNEVKHLNFWSSAEDAFGYMNDIGIKRSSYWHYQLTQNYMNSSSGYTGLHYVPSSIVDLSTPAPAFPDVKSFASKVNNQLVIIIMNQKDGLGSHSYTVNANGTASDPEIKISYSTGLSYTHSDIINNQETHWVVFNCNGVYEGKWVYNNTNHTNVEVPVWIPASPAVTPYHTIVPTCTNCVGLSGTSAAVEFDTPTGPTVANFSWFYNSGVIINDPTVNSHDVALLHQNTVSSGTDTYPYIATAPNGCTTTANFEIETSPGIGFDFYAYISDKTSALCGDDNGTCTIATDGCLSTPTYLWDNSETSNPAIGLSPGMHYVDVTCSGVATVRRHAFISAVSDPIATAGPDRTICLGQSLILNGDADRGATPYTFSWSPSTGLSASNVAKPVATPTVTTTYVLTVTGASPSSCSETDTVIITVNPVPATPVITGDFSTCLRESATPYSISGYSNETQYAVRLLPETAGSLGSISSGGIFNVSWSNNANAVIEVTATNTYGCSSVATFNVYSCCDWDREGSPYFTDAEDVDDMQAEGTSFISSGSSPIIVDQQFAINGTFTVNKDLTIKGCDILMGGNAKIIVAPGKTLTITSDDSDVSHLFACDNMWNGIYIDGNTRGTLLRILDGTTIEDALNAVVSTSAGEYEIVGGINGNVILNKNYRSLVVETTYSHPGVIRRTEITCYDSKTPHTYSNSDLLRAPHAAERSYAGVVINNVSDIKIGNDVSTDDNYFDNLDYGIRSQGSSVTVYNNHFSNFSASGDLKEACPSGTAICAFGGTMFPVKTMVIGNNSSYTSGSNRVNSFTDCELGIVVHGNLSANISQNTFSSAGKAIAVQNNYAQTLNILYNSMSGVNVGISAFDNVSSSLQISENSITTKAGGSGILANEITGSSDAYYKIVNNNISNSRFGIWASGLHAARIDTNTVAVDHTPYSSQWASGITLKNSSHCSVRQNVISGDNYTDWWVNGITVDLAYADTVTCNESGNIGTGLAFGGYQLPGTLIARNTMEKNFRGVLVGYGVLGEQYLHGSGSTKYSSDNSWITPFTESYSESYYSNGLLSPFYVRSSGGMPYNPTGSNNIANPSSTSGVSALTFTSAGNNSSLQSCSAIDTQAPDFDELKTQARLIRQDTTVLPVYQTQARWMMKYDLYNYLVRDSSLLSLDTALANFFNAAGGTVAGKLSYISRVLSDVNATFSELDSADLLNATIVAVNDPQTNQVVVNNILLKRAGSYPEFDSIQLEDLRIIAALCPYSDGKAVLQARAILSNYDTTEFVNSCEFFEPESSHAMMESSAPKSFTLFPNPNNGNMSLRYSMLEGSIGSMEIMDVTGKLVLQYKLQAGENNQLDILNADLNNGVYLYSIVIDGQQRQADKIIVIR
jgi:hypothetical protein